MAPTAELGPLDVQVEHQDREGRIVSALDAAKALNHLAELASNLALAAGPSFIGLTKLPRLEVLRELLQFMAKVIEPAVSKLDPQLIHQAANDLRVAKEYAARMLSMRGDSASKLLAAKDIHPERLANHLVNEYPAHGFVISPDEARQLGLPILDCTDYAKWSRVTGIFAEFLEGGEYPIVKVFADSEFNPGTKVDDDELDDFQKGAIGNRSESDPEIRSQSGDC